MTRTDIELQLADEYGKACRNLAELQAWDRSIGIPEVRVEWEHGRCTPWLRRHAPSRAGSGCAENAGTDRTGRAQRSDSSRGGSQCAC